MEMVYWVIIGALAGFLAKMQFPAKRNENIFALLFLGAVGAMIGGITMNYIGRAGATSTSFLCYLFAFLGAALLLVVQRTLFSQRPT